MSYAKDRWFGNELAMRLDRAAGRAAVRIAMQAAVETKRVTHVVTGTLKRSVHPAPVGYDGGDDEDNAVDGDLLFEDIPVPVDGTVQVGSWLPYAATEWVKRGHPGLTQGVEAVRGARADAILRRAYREEGL